MQKLIITIAPTGNVPTRSMTPHVPLTTEEIVEDILKCEWAGASISHIHVRDKDERPTSNRKLFKEVIESLDKRGSSIVKQLSTGARGGENSFNSRGQMLDLNVHMASLSTGSSNFPNSVNSNTPDLIEALALKMFKNNIKPEIEVFDLAMISNAQKLCKKGILKAPLHFNLVMNVPGSIKGTPKNLMFLVESLPKGATWSVSGIGRSHLQMISLAIVLGGHVRTGLEDTIEYEKDVLATNEMLVQRIVRIANELGRDVATPEEAKEILGL